MKKRAFTLAEVLVTLMIIGVVASMTVPALQNSFEEQRYQADAKKAYAELSNAIFRMQAENITASDYSGQAVANVVTDPNSFKNVFVRYFDVIKDCGAADCVPYSAPSAVYKNLAGGNTNADYNKGQFVTKNGWFIGINTNISGLVVIWVDLNGYQKKPNVLGKDLIAFMVTRTSNKLYPMGQSGSVYDYDPVYCNKTLTTEPSNGAGCTYKLLQGITYW